MKINSQDWTLISSIGAMVFLDITYLVVKGIADDRLEINSTQSFTLTQSSQIINAF